MGKRRIAAVNKVPLRQLEVTPRGKNGGLGRGSGRGRGLVLGGYFFFPGSSGSVEAPVVFPSCFIFG